MRWTVLVPLRLLPGAKSRLAATVAPQRYDALVQAIRADTLAAATAAVRVARVVVVADAPGVGVGVVQTSSGLNGALADGAAYAQQHWPEDGVAALVGDLPALTAAELSTALDEAARHPAAFVPDAEGSGTTMLTAAPGVALQPRFGVGSASRHAEIAVALAAGPGLRCDVDTAADLEAAARAGLGPQTSAAMGFPVHLDPA